MNAHLYLRASTKDQDALRAQATLEAFAKSKGMTIVALYAENVSGTKLDRPQLRRLLESANPGDCLVCESVDRLSRLTKSDWESLKATIKSKGLRLVIVDIPTSHALVDDPGCMGQFLDIVNNMFLDMMATMARLDQETRVKRIRQGLEKKKIAEPDWVPKGKSRNEAKWEKVKSLMAKHPDMAMKDIAKLADVGVATAYRIREAVAGGN